MNNVANLGRPSSCPISSINWRFAQERPSSLPGYRWSLYQPSIHAPKPNVQDLISRILNARECYSMPEIASKNLCKKIRNSSDLQEAVEYILWERAQLNSFIVNSLLSMKASSEEPERLYAFKKELFDHASSDLLTLYSSNAMIKAAEKVNKFQDAEQIFFRETQSGRADKYTYTSYIHIAGKMHYFDRVQAAFDHLPDLLKYKVEIYNAFIQAAYFNSELRQAKEKFDLTLSFGIADKITFGTYLHAARAGRNPEELMRAFQFSESCRNQYIYSTYIGGAAECGMFDEVDRVYMMAKGENRLNVFICTAYLQAAKLQGDLAKAYVAVEDALTLGVADSALCMKYLRMLSEYSDFFAVKEAFAWIRQFFLPDKLFYQTYLQITRDHCQWEEAEKIQFSMFNLPENQSF